MATEAMLTTTDNPFDPFNQYDDWLAFDIDKGYNTPGYLDRITITSSDLSDANQLQDIEDAIDIIVDENVLGLYKKVTRTI